jgi:hypothetical protein
MSTKPHTPPGQGDVKLTRPTAADERQVMSDWRRVDSGMAGPRGGMPENPDDAVAYRLIEAANAAMERGDWQRGVNILRLVIRDYRQSHEAALARTVIDRLASRSR